MPPKPYPKFNNSFAYAREWIYKAIDEGEKAKDTAVAAGDDEDEAQKMGKGREMQVLNIGLERLRKILHYQMKVQEVYDEVMSQYAEPEEKQKYFITIRPDEKICNFNMFARQIAKYVKRACILSYTLTYEQKGESFDELGKGFHCHIVADGTWKSKGEALRDTQSTFKHLCAPNCIDIKTTKNAKDIIQNYMIDYKSNDEHKEKTMVYDQAWRLELGINAIYYDDYFEPTEDLASG